MRGLFANRWLVVIACILGLLASSGPIMIFSFGVFLIPVTQDLGISRGTLSSALAPAGVLISFASLIVGWLIDRWGTRRLMIPGILLFAAAVASLGLMQAQPAFLIFLLYAVLGLVGSVQTPVPYSAVITQWFDRNRGLALGLATAGVGVGVIVIPKLAALLIDKVGWRETYSILAILVLVVAWLPVALFVREPPGLLRESERKASANLTDVLPGLEAAAAFKKWEFWALTVAFFLGVLAINGTLVHVPALLIDRGIPGQSAANAMIVAGVAIVFGRILAGWFLDRFWGPYVAMCFFILPMIGIALFASGAGGFVPFVAALLSGLGIGAEIDMMAFFISRYFGLKAFGKIYGLMFAIFTAGTTIGPAISGLSFDRFHSYGPILIAFEVALAITCLLFLGLGPYPYPAPKREEESLLEQKAAA
jgi:MFS family permease